MPSIFQLVILLAALRIVVVSERPLLCAVGFTVLNGLLALIFGYPLQVVAVDAVIVLMYTSLYFYLLVRYLGAGAVWYVILLVGAVLPVVIRFVLPIWQAHA